MIDNGGTSLHVRNEQHFVKMTEEPEIREDGSDLAFKEEIIQVTDNQHEALENDGSNIEINTPEKLVDADQNLEVQAKHALETVDKYWTALSSKSEELQEVVEVEQKNMSVNELKLEDDWVALGRIAKVESLHRDIDVIRQSHNAEVDRKNAVIQVLEAGLDEAENQFSLAVKSHSDNLYYLVDLNSSRLLAMKKAFEKELEEMQTTFQNDRECIETIHDEEMVGILRLISVVKTKEEETSAVECKESQQVCVGLQNRNLEKLNMLRSKLETKAQNIDEQLKATDNNYNQATMELSAEFKNMTVNDTKLEDDIDVKSKHIERFQVELQYWRDKMSHNIHENEFRNDLLNQKKSTLANQYQALKRTMIDFGTKRHRHLVELSHDATRAKTKLVQHLGLAERILRLAEVCHMNTIEEKLNEVVIGKCNSMATNHDKADNAQENLKDGIMGNKRNATTKKGDDASYVPMYLDKAGEKVQPDMHLEIFLRKFNRLQLGKLAIQKERDRLESENKRLKCALQAVDKNNLLVVNGKTALNSCGGQSLPKILPGKQKYDTTRQEKLKDKFMLHA